MLAAYVAAFGALYGVVGSAVWAFGFVPVLIAGALHGPAAGALAGVILVPINVMLYRTAGSGLVSWANHVLPGLAALFVGAVVGRLRDMGALLVDKQKHLQGALAQLSLAQEVTAKDTTERREHVTALQIANAELAAAHAAAKRSADNLRKVLESIPDAVIMTRLDGSVAFVNGPGQSMLGIAPGSPVTTKSVLERVLPEDHPILMRRREAAAAGRDPGSAAVRVLTKSGIRECEISGLRVDFDGQPAIVTVARDVSERREMERKLAITERMASLGTLAGGVAHEINNPLSYVLSNLRYLSGELVEMEARTAPGWLPEARQVLDETLAGAERVRRIVQDLHAFSRPSERLGPVDVHRVLDLAINMASSQIRYRAVVVKDYAEVPFVLGDDSRLGQVALNLLLNAAQAIPDGRPNENEIRISTRKESVDRVAIEVRDTGCGVPPEIRRRIFEPFFTTKPIGTGTGLGLSICHGIVSSLGGEITIESAVGRGSTFRVVLPAATQARVT
jgi:PAS domain S-box-containing protein